MRVDAQYTLPVHPVFADHMYVKRCAGPLEPLQYMWRLRCNHLAHGSVAMFSQADSDSLVQEDPDDEEGEFDLQQSPPKITGVKMPYLHLKLFKHSWRAKNTLKRQQGLHP